MASETINGKVDTTKLVKEMSRETFRDMPRPRRIDDKRRKAPRYGHKLED